MTPPTVRAAIRRSLKAQGFRIGKRGITFRQRHDKRSVRKRHKLSVLRKVSSAELSLRRHETDLLAHIASGNEVDPRRIRPRLVRVEAGTWESRLFRYASLHWSIPVSDGYGRRLRFLIFDDANGKLIGLFGLGDPVYSIRARDELIGWTATNRAARLYHVMDAYVLGAYHHTPICSVASSWRLRRLAMKCARRFAHAMPECALFFRDANVNRIWCYLRPLRLLGARRFITGSDSANASSSALRGSPVDGANFIFPTVFTICSPTLRMGIARRQRSVRSGARDFAIGANLCARRSPNSDTLKTCSIMAFIASCSQYRSRGMRMLFCARKQMFRSTTECHL